MLRDGGQETCKDRPVGSFSQSLWEGLAVSGTRQAYVFLGHRHLGPVFSKCSVNCLQHLRVSSHEIKYVIGLLPSLNKVPAGTVRQRGAALATLRGGRQVFKAASWAADDIDRRTGLHVNLLLPEDRQELVVDLLAREVRIDGGWPLNFLGVPGVLRSPMKWPGSSVPLYFRTGGSLMPIRRRLSYRTCGSASRSQLSGRSGKWIGYDTACHTVMPY